MTHIVRNEWLSQGLVLIPLHGSRNSRLRYGYKVLSSDDDNKAVGPGYFNGDTVSFVSRPAAAPRRVISLVANDFGIITLQQWRREYLQCEYCDIPYENAIFS